MKMKRLESWTMAALAVSVGVLVVCSGCSTGEWMSLTFNDAKHFQAQQLDAHSATQKLMTEQHSVMAPDKATELEQVSEMFAAAMAKMHDENAELKSTFDTMWMSVLGMGSAGGLFGIGRKTAKPKPA